MLYLDAAATDAVRREALEAAWPYLTGVFGNPSSHHSAGEAAAAGLADARSRVASVLGARRSDVAFTSGGSEAANLAIKGLALANPRGKHLVTSPIEHEAVLGSIDHLRRVHGFEVSFVTSSADGTITPEALREELREDTTLVSLAYANNEVGVVSDVPALAEEAHRVGALLHTDAVQAAGWLDLRGLGADALTISGHKLGAPKGIGAAIIRGRLPLEPLVHGGGQEGGRRSGTENVAFAVALATALELAESEREETATRLAPLRDAFIARVLRAREGALVTGPTVGAAGEGQSSDAPATPPARRLPGHASFCFPGTSGESVLLDLEEHGVIASSGSACAAGSDEPSHVLTALGVPREVAQTAVRFSFPRSADAQTLEAAIAAVESVLRER
ncbi:cysteine desulfurase [Brachybacterium halotolerans subsp. kimchii]|uniref:cysteine desulfurase family protein n=1 Tax=Brachybacterium halotolerans TaxID=2795215 RepID=UPI001E4E7200|nr:cysteine desulfurase family protein [Brachybacterium halotolerans]UEJ81697.1 cysteine desulfurase [Brachybacterium halotolerans subsp. kimchii]